MSEQSNGDDEELEVLLDSLAEAAETPREADSSERSEIDGEPAPVDSDGELDVRGARDACRAIAEELTGRPLDGVAEVQHEDEGGWRVVVEMVERSSIPDTQDILGRYVIRLDATGIVRGYSRAGRYRRASFDHQREAILADEH
ncbi:gas vesicle protein GvpO [Haladaptatus sp. DFWS20]|uniref:gas vesicle protein GvpO n=1 Tax=Haladaptatus sp. DFWS20 TaxID=3403467 RepID=UPI003EB9CC3C